MPRTDAGWIDAGVMAKRLGVSRQAVRKTGERMGGCRRRYRFTPTGPGDWWAEEIEQALAAGPIRGRTDRWRRIAVRPGNRWPGSTRSGAASSSWRAWCGPQVRPKRWSARAERSATA